MTREEAIKRLELIVKHSEGGNYHYRIKANDWKKEDPETGEIKKHRVYLSIVETRENSKHYKTREYGYLDMLTGEYVAERNDLTRNFTFGGMTFEE